MGKVRRQSANGDNSTPLRGGRPNPGRSTHWNPIEKSAKVNAVAGVAGASAKMGSVISVVPAKVTAVPARLSSGVGVVKTVATATMGFVHHSVQNLPKSKVPKDLEMTLPKEENPGFQSKIFLLSKLLLEGPTKELEGLFGENKEFMEGYIGKNNDEIKEALEDLIEKYKKYAKNRLKNTT